MQKAALKRFTLAFMELRNVLDVADHGPNLPDAPAIAVTGTAWRLQWAAKPGRRCFNSRGPLTLRVYIGHQAKVSCTRSLLAGHGPAPL
jgi:hypothetical protein